MNKKQLTAQIKKQIANKVDASNKVTVTNVTFQGLKELSKGSFTYEIVTAKVSFIDYMFGENGVESFKNSYAVSFDGLTVERI